MNATSDKKDFSKEVESLVKSRKFPDISDIGPIARKMGITSVRQFWELVEQIQREWRENHNYEAEWDNP